MTKGTDVFADPQAVANYAEGPPRLVPGFADLQRMAMLLLAESTPPDARVLVVGAGGGLELKVFAEHQPAWQFDGVDPSAEMLKLAQSTLGPLISRVAVAPWLHQCRARGTVRCGGLSADSALHSSRGTIAHAAGDSAPAQTRRAIGGRASQLSARRERARAMAFAIRQLCGFLGCRSRESRERARCDRGTAADPRARTGRSDSAGQRLHERQPVLRRVHVPRVGRSRVIGGMMDKPRIFLGSSATQTKLLQSLTRGLEDIAQVEPWTASFNPGTTTLDRLLELTREVDFAAFVFARDDWTVKGAASAAVHRSGFSARQRGLRGRIIWRRARHAPHFHSPRERREASNRSPRPHLHPLRRRADRCRDKGHHPEGSQGNRERASHRRHRGPVVAVLPHGAHRARSLPP